MRLFKIILFISFSLIYSKVEGQKKLHSVYTLDSAKSSTILDTSLLIDFINSAHKYIGAKHKMGGLSKQGLDCSGLIYLAAKEVGLQLPHSANGQAFYGYMIDEIDALLQGDLVFFTGTYKSNHYITHVGIYLGNGMFIHTSSSKGVILSNLLVSSYWKPKFAFAKRLF